MNIPNGYSDGGIPQGRLTTLIGRPDYSNDPSQLKNELVALRTTAKNQKIVLLACKQFFEQLQEKGVTLSFTERTAVGILLEKIKGLE